MAQRRREKAQPFSLRLTETEKAVLQAKAGNVPIGTFVRDVLLGDGAQSRIVRRSPVKDGEALGRVLAMLGQSGLAAGLNDLVRQAAAGTFYVDDDVKVRLRRALDAVIAMRALLMQALGKKGQEPEPEIGGDLTSTFDRAAKRDGGR